MPSARASSRGDFLNCRLAVNGIQKADCSRPATNSARLFTATSLPQGRYAAAQKQLCGEGDDFLALLPESLDGELHHVAGLEEHRCGLDAEADAWRRAGGDDVARQERHVVADVRDDLRDAEHHGARVAGLHALAVDLERHAECLRVADLV